MTALKAKHQRLVLLVMAVVALTGAALLASWYLRNEASFFYLPGQMAANPPEAGQLVRLGGMVETGSLSTRADGITIDFAVNDGEGRVPVSYTGILPDLFVEGSGAVADGRLNANGVFVAETLLAKHDENYVPVELQDMTDRQAKESVTRTVATGPSVAR